MQEGTNVLSIHGLNVAAANVDFLMAPELLVHRRDPIFALAFNEVSAAGEVSFRLELVNQSQASIDLGGSVIARSGSPPNEFVLPHHALDAGGYWAVSAAELGFHPAAGEKLFLYAPGGRGLVDAVAVTTSLRGRSPDGMGPWLNAGTATFGAANPVALQREIVLNEIMYHHQPIFETPGVYAESALLSVETVWRFNQSGTDLGTAWREPGFDDSSWGSGLALFYATTAALPAPKNTSLTLGPRTYYFRTEFLFDGHTNGVTFALEPILDDGAIFYLNGVELLRRNMPGTTVSFTTLASSAVGTATFSGPFPIPAARLLEGTNTLAVEVHQASSADTDVVFGLRLSARKELMPPTPFRESPEGWIELFNRGTNAVDLTGWRLDGEMGYRFPGGTTLSAGGYLVVANDPAALLAQFPGVNVVGPFTGQLSHRGAQIILRDAHDNPADEVSYFDGGRWPKAADGGGPSLELRDPRADHAAGEAWAASDESAVSAWRTYTYRGVAAPSLGPDGQWQEFVLGLLDAGEVLLDDVSVVEDPDGARVPLLKNSSFTAGLAGWRVIGNHHGDVVPDPLDAGNQVLHLVARGPTEHWSNHAETTLAGNRSIVNGRVYEISFRAKWMAGCPKLNTRLYFNRLPRTTLLQTPPRHGTPGAPNSRLVANLGPTFQDLHHTPVVPAPGESVTVSVRPSDLDGISALTLYWSTDSARWSSSPMTGPVDGRYAGAIPGFPAATVVQFYVQAADGLGAESFFPAAGPAARALFKVQDGQANFANGHNVRILMTAADTATLHRNSNLMGNDPVGCTVLYDEMEVFYEAAVRLRGTCYARPYDQFVSFSLYFPSEHLFRGAHGSIDLDRSGRGPVGSPGQDEILIRHLITRGGGLPGDYADLVRVLAPRAEHTSSSLLYLNHYTGDYLDSAFPGGSESMLFELDGAYYPTATIDGNPESPKVVEAGPISYTDIRNLGDNPEGYRWNFPTHNQRDRDDYSRLIAMAKAFDLSGASLDAATRQLIDVSEWMRLLAVLSLTGIGDVYTQGNPHNLWLYVRPTDGRILALPHDLDVSFARDVSAPLTGDNGNVLKILNLPANQRLFFWHLRDMITRVWNPGYMGYWADHYDTFLPGQDFSGILSYISQRGSYVLKQLPVQIPFSITSNKGFDFLTNQPNAVLAGGGWLDLRQIYLVGATNPLPLTWTRATNWQVTLPLVLGINLFTLVAVNDQGGVIGTDTITVTTSAPGGGLDTDGDGMPDAWELAQGLSPFMADGAVDSDGDGVTNYEEFLAGTDPLDRRSALKLVAARTTNDAVALMFSAMAGRKYALEQRERVDTGAWLNLTDIPAAITNRTFQTIAPLAAGMGQRYYRVTVK